MTDSENPPQSHVPPLAPRQDDYSDDWNQAVQQSHRRNFVANIGSGPIGVPAVLLQEAAKVASDPGRVVTFVNDKGEPVTLVNDKDETATWRTNAPELQTASRQIIERRLLERPDDIRAAARNLAHAFEQQVKELREGIIPNEPIPLAQYKNLLDFLEQMAGGLAELADALDQAFSSATDSPTSSPEPVLLGKPAEIVRWLQGLTQRWREEIGTSIISVPIRFGVLLGGIEFLHWLGADSAAAIGALWLTCKDLQGPSSGK